MNLPLRRWRQLERLKVRRLEEQEAALAPLRQAVQDAESALALAREGVLRRQIDLDQSRGRMAAMFEGGQTFSPHRMLMTRHELDAGSERLVEAQRQSQLANQRLRGAQGELQFAMDRWQRLKQQLEQVRERMTAEQRGLEQAQDDLQDEEAEEGAAARFIVARRAEENIRAGGV